MKRINILCPNCFKGKLLEVNKGDCLCDKCGQEFRRTGEKSVKFISKVENEVVICKYCRKKEYYFSMRWLNGKELCRSCYKKEYEDFTGDLYEWNDLDGFRPK